MLKGTLLIIVFIALVGVIAASLCWYYFAVLSVLDSLSDEQPDKTTNQSRAEASEDST